MNEPMDRLLAQQACRDLVLRAAACADAGDAQALAQLFTEDGVLVRPNAEPLQGRAAIHAAYSQRPAGRITRHLVSNTLVEFDTALAARALSYVLLWAGVQSDEDGPCGRPAAARQMVGEFADHFARMADGRWLIRRREARFVLYRDS
jgi:uncharacterized protein (TIGR02246 family)